MSEFVAYDRIMTRAITSAQYARIADRRQLIDFSRHPHNDSDFIMYIRADATFGHRTNEFLGIFKIGQDIEINPRGKSGQVLDTLMTISGLTHDEWDKTYPQGTNDLYYVCPIYEQIKDFNRYLVGLNQARAKYEIREES